MSFTFGNAYSFWYSLAGAALSFLIMALLRRQDWFGELGVSVAGGVCHNIGQIAVAAIVLRSTAAAYYQAEGRLQEQLALLRRPDGHGRRRGGGGADPPCPAL